MSSLIYQKFIFICKNFYFNCLGRVITFQIDFFVQTIIFKYMKVKNDNS